jgi:hypothetical protein
MPRTRYIAAFSNDLGRNGMAISWLQSISSPPVLRT